MLVSGGTEPSLQLPPLRPGGVGEVGMTAGIRRADSGTGMEVHRIHRIVMPHLGTCKFMWESSVGAEVDRDSIWILVSTLCDLCGRSVSLRGVHALSI